MKLIFLDIDGPIAWGTWLDGKIDIVKGIDIPYAWDQEQCDALARIINATDASVIISSDWKKFYTLIELKEIFKFYKVPVDAIIGTTSTDKAKMSSSGSMDRAYQIAKVVKKLQKDIEEWIAIDDYEIGSWFEDMKSEYPFISKKNAVQLIGDFSNVTTKLTEVEEKIINHLNGR